MKTKYRRRLCLVFALLLLFPIPFLLSPKILTEAEIKTEIAPPPIEKKAIVKPAPALPQALLDISKCESGNRQFNADGSVLRGRENPDDVGQWQINETYWLEKSRELGFDIYSQSGNEKMALWIYTKYGAKPWSWSAFCHGHYQ